LLIIEWPWLATKKLQLLTFQLTYLDALPTLAGSPHRGKYRIETPLSVKNRGMTFVRRRALRELKGARLSVFLWWTLPWMLLHRRACPLPNVIEGTQKTKSCYPIMPKSRHRGLTKPTVCSTIDSTASMNCIAAPL
jgi:hypothetical protein